MSQAHTRSRRYARLERPGEAPFFAELEGGFAQPLRSAPWHGGVPEGEPLAGFDEEGRGPLRRLAPVTPSKIICIGRNYKAHANELGNEVPAEPLLFLKPPSSLLDPEGAIELPPSSISQRVDHEVELGVVIGMRARRVPASEAMSHVFGYTLVGDITARDLQKKDGQWTRAKGMDTFCPVGPVVVSDLPAQSLSLSGVVNGELRQHGSTADMIFPIPELIAYISRVITLEPGDLLVTGTPPGVGPLCAGDRLEITVPEIGTLRVSVVASPTP
jgi:2-keto-4-pentenoate hydratase/2-oxohepta-3-ene-1,7-dioic acid hydratase in catechol pathway